MTKVVEWIEWHVTVPVEAILLMKRTFHEEIESDK